MAWAEGLAQASWAMKQAVIAATSRPTTASTSRNPRARSASTSSTSTTVMHTPANIGRPNRRFSPIAMPSTSARLQATIATSLNSHRARLVRRPKWRRQACARSSPPARPRRTAAAWNSIAIRLEAMTTASSVSP